MNIYIRLSSKIFQLINTKVFTTHVRKNRCNNVTSVCIVVSFYHIYSNYSKREWSKAYVHVKYSIFVCIRNCIWLDM